MSHSNSNSNRTTTGPNSERSREGELPTSGQSDADLAAESAPGQRTPGEDLRRRQEQLLDESIEESFPASDPISPVRITK